MSSSIPSIGTTATTTHLVSEADLPSAVLNDANNGIQLPEVLSTPRMIGLMELASCNLLSPYLPAGHISIGTSVNVVHTAPSPLGTEVTATATFKGMEGRTYVFDVQARNSAGEVGFGSHKRAVVDLVWMEKAAEKQMLRIDQANGKHGSRR